MSKRAPRHYDVEFKLNAIKLYKESGKSYNTIGEELGVPISTLAGWFKEYEESTVDSFPGKGNVKQSDAEINRLRKELAIACEERDILKKALVIFSSIKK